jgi:hypothetical protein
MARTTPSVRKALRGACALAGLLAALAASGGASGHGVGTQLGYVSTVSHVDPLVLGVTAKVVGGDDRLRVANLSRQTIVILGYGSEPYLRFSRDGVYENLNSPAVYRDRDRWGVAVVPASARPGAKPRWRRVTALDSYNWHDHRIHWMQRGVQPAVVRAAPNRQHKVFDWSVPARADGKPFAIKGFLGYAPRPQEPKAEENSRTALWVGGAAAVLLALSAVVIFLRRIAP